MKRKSIEKYKLSFTKYVYWVRRTFWRTEDVDLIPKIVLLLHNVGIVGFSLSGAKKH